MLKEIFFSALPRPLFFILSRIHWFDFFYKQIVELMKIEAKFFLIQLTGLTVIYLQYSNSPFSLHSCTLHTVIAAKFSQLNFENEEYIFK